MPFGNGATVPAEVVRRLSPMRSRVAVWPGSATARAAVTLMYVSVTECEVAGGLTPTASGVVDLGGFQRSSQHGDCDRSGS
jgi:hypothetical protein